MGGVSRAIFAAGGRGVPGPGSYIRPLTDGRGSSGGVKGVPGVKFGRPKSASDATRRPNMVAISRRADDTPGPGAYINPLTDGRNADGERIAILSNQRSTRTVGFGPPRPKSATSFRS